MALSTLMILTNLAAIIFCAAARVNTHKRNFKRFCPDPPCPAIPTTANIAVDHSNNDFFTDDATRTTTAITTGIWSQWSNCDAAGLRTRRCLSQSARTEKPLVRILSSCHGIITCGHALFCSYFFLIPPPFFFNYFCCCLC